MMLPLATLGRFDFDARLLPVQSIDDTKYKSGKDSQTNAACDKSHGSTASDDQSGNGNLVWRDSCFTEKCDNSRFDRCVKVSRQIKRPFLCGIENDPLSQAAVLLQRRPKTNWTQVPRR